MSLPPLAPYPPAAVRTALGPQEWEACLDAWLSLSALYLRSTRQQFETALLDENLLIPFLTTYHHVLAQDHHGQTQAKEHALKRSAFILVHRALLTLSHPPNSFLQWNFLSDFCHVYMKTQSLDVLMQKLWQSRRPELERALQQFLTSTMKQLESSQPNNAEDSLKRIVPLVFSSPQTGTWLMTGSEFVDTMSAGYRKGSSGLQKALSTVTYHGLISLTKGDKPNISLLFDHLYSLKGEADKSSSTPASLLADLVTNTSILSKMRTIDGKYADRAQTIATTFSSYNSPSISRQRRARKVNKGKGKASQEEQFGHGALSGDHHVHRMSLITQIQDLFPDLGSGFVARLLDEYDDNAEQVTAHLLDDSLPPHLQSLDRSAQIPMQAPETEEEKIQHLAPRSTPPPQRRNVFDNDEFDRLEVDASRMHIGRKNAKLTADAVLADRSSAPAKSAILSALAAFDSDDDERDDTYDEADVGGYVDSARPDGEESRDTDTGNQGENEEALFRAWQINRSVFERSSDIRRGAARAALKNETGMQDEAIEGWALMLSRDPRRLKRLEARFAAFAGAQTGLERTAYRESEATEESDGPDGGHRGNRGGRGGGRGRGRGGRGGGNPAGPPGEKTTQNTRNRKEARGSGRREGRARKMARSGFPG